MTGTGADLSAVDLGGHRKGAASSPAKRILGSFLGRDIFLPFCFFQMSFALSAEFILSFGRGSVNMVNTVALLKTQAVDKCAVSCFIT